ncbi:MAG: hypothetical protein WCV92_03845 [Candidatus Buchananbacteria bacterium]
MSDDNKLKIILYTIVILTIIAVIGAWELFVQPIVLFVAPFIADFFNTFFQTARGL